MPAWLLVLAGHAACGWIYRYHSRMSNRCGDGCWRLCRCVLRSGQLCSLWRRRPLRRSTRYPWLGHSWLCRASLDAFIYCGGAY
jgi:hypothetical protein